jgi:acetyl esterase
MSAAPPPGAAPPAARLDPAIALILRDLQAAGAPDPATIQIKEARAGFAAMQRIIGGEAPPPEVARVDDSAAPGPGGPLPLRHYRPSTDPVLPAVVYFHGGGWTFGDLDSHDRALRRLALGAGAAVVAVDYRLAPEHPFPLPLDDAVTATRWVRDHAADLGIDGGRIVLAGDSAGANLALAALLAIRDTGDPLPCGGGLFYGCFWSRLDTESHARLGRDYMLTTDRMRWFWGNYLGNREPGDPFAEPIHADLQGLPPLYLCAAGFDPLLDDTIELARRLAEAGVPHEYRVHPELIHGFMQMTARSEAAARAADAASAALKRLLLPAGAA